MFPPVVDLVGCLFAMQTCKNLVLAGINVTVQDTALVTHADLASQFFLTEADVGKNVRAHVVCMAQGVALPVHRPCVRACGLATAACGGPLCHSVLRRRSPSSKS